MIDTHAHLGDDAAEVLGRARDAGVTRVIDVATSLAGARRSLARAEATDAVHCVLGIHPHEAAGFDLAALDELQELLDHPRAVAVGETGLDYFRDYAPPAAQQALFDAQLTLASDTGKPVVDHWFSGVGRERELGVEEVLLRGRRRVVAEVVETGLA